MVSLALVFTRARSVSRRNFHSADRINHLAKPQCNIMTVKAEWTNFSSQI